MTLAAQLPEALTNLPWLVQVPVALAFVAGLILWLAGRAVIRPVTIMTGLGLGGLLGFILLPVMLPGLAISPYLGLLGGAASGLTLALLLYQVATAVTFGSAIGAGCGITAAAVLGTALALPSATQLNDTPPTPVPPENPGQLGGGEQPVYVPPPVWNPRIDPLPEPEAEGPEGADVENPGVIRAKPVARPKPKPHVLPPKPVSEKPATKTTAKSASGERTAGRTARPSGSSDPSHRESIIDQSKTSSRGAAMLRGGAAEQVREFWNAARSSSAAWWDAVPAANKPWILGATVAGIAAGTLLGILLPAWAAGGVTALAGAAIWLPAAVWLGTAWSVPGMAHARGLTSGGWIAIWLTLAVLGVACQWYGLMPGKKGKAKTRKRKPKSDEDE